ncbi:MAG: radical SAM protein [Deltaproteobacteria bacterium]|nr:radical SAM protein [Deltaproteobacteria bacterium]
MQVIYEPKGRAREFAPLAANLYRGCGHGCLYCFGPQTLKMKRDAFSSEPKPRKDVLKFLEKDARKYRGDGREILLSFTSDPYQPLEMKLNLIRRAIEILIRNQLRFTILTKGGMRASRDFDLLERCDRCRFGTTLVFINQADASRWEPNASPVSERIEAIKAAHKRGIKTWVSLEPVIDPDQALELIRLLHPVVGHWKVGKLNYKSPDKPVDWIKFRDAVTDLLGSLGADYYIKKSLTEL